MLYGIISIIHAIFIILITICFIMIINFLKKIFIKNFLLFILIFKNI